jgi:hypothetical protein
MKIFAAIADAEIVKKFYDNTAGTKLNYLISYFYLDGQASKITKEYRNMIESLYLDSGAYSAERQSINISVSEYTTYLKLYGNLFDEYFNLDDKFDDPDHNFSNQEFIEKSLPKTRKPIPVLHNNEDPLGEFQMYVDLGYDYIAMGSTTKIPDAVFEGIKQKYPEIKIHIFGRLDWDVFKKFKPYSADSATWGIAAGNGNIYFWDDEELKIHTIKIGNRDRNDKIPHFNDFEKRQKVEEFLNNKFKWNYSNLLRKGGAEKRMIVNLYFYKQMENYLNSLP